MTVSPYPHPAFPDVLLPKPVRSELQKDNKTHYPQRYLDQIQPLDSPPNNVRPLGLRMYVVIYGGVFGSAAHMSVYNSRILRMKCETGSDSHTQNQMLLLISYVWQHAIAVCQACLEAYLAFPVSYVKHVTLCRQQNDLLRAWCL